MRKFTMVLAFFMLCAAIFGCSKSTEDNQSNEAAALVEMKQEASATVQSEAGDTIPDWTLYWLYMTRPISDNPLGVDTFYLQAEAIGDEAAAKDELIQFAQSWNPHATMDH